MKLSDVSTKLTCMKSNVVRVLAVATLAGAVLTAATPAARAQQYGDRYRDGYYEHERAEARQRAEYREREEARSFFLRRQAYLREQRFEQERRERAEYRGYDNGYRHDDNRDGRGYGR